MIKSEAVEKLKQLIGTDIRQMAEKYEVTVWKDGKINKGWFGHVIERYLGLPINSSQSPNFGSWELKTVPLKRLKNGIIVPKETMAITMIDPFNVKMTEFEESHLYAKLRKMVICTNIFESKEEKSRILHNVIEFNLDDKEMLRIIKQDYQTVRDTIINQGFEKLTGKMGVYIQPRTKGQGHGSVSRAFYARTNILKLLFKF
ncbi:MvaI/BcnI family restriction endonuclease [Candidatus Deianiraea vastatrix]|uniref:DNA mismatch repair protein MutH n=1 Tax=Candidatus Deianiraea vastatrix TaxID=2163644 RepID=A0A5B8XGV1_9RICK|nr:MvaI/BcnI family restriction endonuclease [Candidatus Deianiraea vastatrix]QED23444.1 DNA mismatch repair protein MutH [Candidatus Deianiraea vastatrix]